MDSKETKRAKLAKLIEEAGGPDEIVYRLRTMEGVKKAGSTVYRWAKFGLGLKVPHSTVSQLARVLGCRPEDIADDGRRS